MGARLTAALFAGRVATGLSRRLGRGGGTVIAGHVVPRIGALLSDGAAYRYLPRSVAYLPAADVMVESLRSAGFSQVTHTQLTGGLTQLMVATRSLPSGE